MKVFPGNLNVDQTMQKLKDNQGLQGHKKGPQHSNQEHDVFFSKLQINFLIESCIWI